MAKSKKYYEETEKNLNNYKEQYRGNKPISKENRAYFDSYLKAMELKCTPATMRFKYRDIPAFLEMVGNADLKKIMFDRDKINDIFNKIKNKKKAVLGIVKKGEKRELSDNFISLGTYNCILNQTIAFVRWLNDGEKPKGFRDIKQERRATRKLTVKDMIDYNDMKQLQSFTTDPMLRFFLKISLEIGDRVSGLLDTTVDKFEYDQKRNIVKVSIDDKTGMRESFFIKAIPEYIEAKKFHAGRSKYFFIITHGNQIRKINYNTIRAKLQRLKQLADFKKPLNPHNFRHSAIRMAKLEGVPFEIAKRQFGISSESIYDGYGRIDGEDIKQYFLEKAEGKEEQGEKVFSIVCPFCDTPNDPSNDFCDKCRNPLSIKALNKEKDKEIKCLKEEMNEFRKEFAWVREKLAFRENLHQMEKLGISSDKKKLAELKKLEKEMDKKYLKPHFKYEEDSKWKRLKEEQVEEEIKELEK